MNYQIYEKNLIKYNELLNKLDLLLQQKEKAFMQTLPKGIDYSKDKVDNKGAADNLFDKYVISTERLNQEIAELKKLIFEREDILNKLEIKLKNSCSIYDQIYYYRKIVYYKVTDIALLMHYSESQIYRIMQRMNIR